MVKNNTSVTNEDVFQALKNIVPENQISGLQIDDSGSVLFSILVDPSEGPKMEETRQQAEGKIKNLKGVSNVQVVLTAKSVSKTQSQIPDPHGMNKNPKLNLHIKKIIAVASGKGGVGKSTVAVNIAGALARQGHKVGLLDADIYGPSVPRLCGLPYRKPNMSDDKKLIPFEAHGMKVMSMGFMAEPDKAMIWRGPMVQSAIYQMLRDVDWGSENEPLDVLIIDMPPGTGDAQLTIAQKIDVDGAIIVSTPQDLAMIDAVKAIEMFRKTDVPILGLVENMSTHVCGNCGHKEHIFGHDLQEECKKRDVAYLSSIPLNISIRENCDSGKLSDLDVYSDISKQVEQLVFDTV